MSSFHIARSSSEPVGLDGQFLFQILPSPLPTCTSFACVQLLLFQNEDSISKNACISNNHGRRNLLSFKFPLKTPCIFKKHVVRHRRRHEKIPRVYFHEIQMYILLYKHFSSAFLKMFHSKYTSDDVSLIHLCLQ